MTHTTPQSLLRSDAGRIVDENDPSTAARYRLNDIYATAWLSHAVSAVAEYRVADYVADTPIHYEDLALATKLHSPSLYRALRALSANGIFKEVGDGLFEHTEVSRLLRTDHPCSWSGMSRMWDHPSCLSAWGQFRHSLQDGYSGIQHAFGKTLYEHLGEHPHATAAFSDAMISNSAHAATAIAKTLPFEHFKSVMDLGGGVGTLLLEILRIHPHLQGTILEIAELQAAAEQEIARQKMQARCSFARGDFLTYVPQGADLFLVKNSMWNWTDDKCLAIMKNVRAAIGTADGARFVIIEYILDEKNAKWSTCYDLQILNMPGGRARTEAEYTALLAQAGFTVESLQYAEDQTLVIAAPHKF